MRVMSNRRSRRRSPGLRAALVALAVVFASVTAGHAGVTTISEYRTKGSYLLNFIRLVEWRPPRPIAGVLPVCVFGESPIGPVLDELASAPVNGRQVVVQRLADPRKAGSCEVLFITESRWNEVESIARTVPSGVLTVSEINTDDMVGRGDQLRGRERSRGVRRESQCRRARAHRTDHAPARPRSIHRRTASSNQVAGWLGGQVAREISNEKLTT
jgi:hypothetical protein